MPEFIEQFEAFHAAAIKAAGLEDFGEIDYHEPLRILLADYDRQDSLSPTGQRICAGDIIGKLISRLLAQEGLKKRPELRSSPLEKPIIIIGMGRTGTTTLHRLMAQDPATQALELWLGMRPMPRPPRESWDDLPEFREVEDQIAALHTVAPSLLQIHPMHAEQPDECKFALDQSFFSPTTATLARVPEYRDRLLQTDPDFANRRYRELLQLIARGDQRRWVLKNPDHIFALDSLMKAFPDACVVQTHRDPLTAVASLASVSYIMRRMREPECSLREHGSDMRAWLSALEKAEAARARHDPQRFFDLHIRELSADPAGSVERIYQHFGLDISDEARAAWQASARRDPRGGHGAHNYSPEDFGLSLADVEQLAPSHYDRYRRDYGHFD